MIRELRELNKKAKLSPIHKILLTTDGSITRILEALEGEEIQVKTERQEIIKANSNIAKLLKIAVGEEVNYRAVNLQNSKGMLIHAISYAPLKRLKDEFRDEIMKEDTPIGKIMAKLKIEGRREIRGFEIIKANERLSRLFKIPLNSKLLKRNYDIIHRNKILINITEIFPYEVFKYQ